MEIDHIAVFLLDTKEKLFAAGERESILEGDSKAFIECKLEKLFSANQRKAANLSHDHWLISCMHQYQQNMTDFLTAARLIAKRYYESKIEFGVFDASSLAIAEVLYNERRFFVLLDQGYRQAFSCYMQDDEEAVYQQQRFLSGSLLKGDFGFTLELSDSSFHIIEQKKSKENEDLLSLHFLQVQAAPSYDEVHKEMEKTVVDLSEKYEMDAVEALNKVKQMTRDRIEEQEEIHIDEIAESVFEEVPFAADEFCSRMKEKGLDQAVSTEKVKMKKSSGVQRIKTDTDVEIIFPIEYMTEQDKLEIVHENDGTIVIAVKNVSRIKSR